MRGQDFGLWQDHEPVFRTDNTVLDPRFCYLLIIGENHGAVDEDWWQSSGSSTALTGWLFERKRQKLVVCRFWIIQACTLVRYYKQLLAALTGFYFKVVQEKVWKISCV